VNGFNVTYEGRADATGTFRALLHHGDQTLTLDDLVRLSIQRFLEVIRHGKGRPFVDGQDTLKNMELEMLIKVGDVSITQERSQMTRIMLDAMYVNTRTKKIVAYRPKGVMGAVQALRGTGGRGRTAGDAEGGAACRYWKP
jgi:hypothetical protein